MSTIIDLFQHGQSVWLDYIDRGLLTGGGLKGLVSTGLRGVTSNPAIFCKAIGKTDHYDETIRDLIHADHAIDETALYQWLTVEDARMAADILRGVYDSSDGADGYVSLEVSPHLSDDTEGTVDAAHRLWKAVDRPNLMIKVPATKAGLPAIERLIGEGINVNATLLFSVDRYEAVAQAYVRGLAANPEPAKVASVASLFVSRVDTKVDKALGGLGTEQAQALKGKIAIANAKLAYQRFRAITASEAFAAQRKRGARPQRPLWASTGTKDPAYSDVLYLEGLIGPGTVTTVPPDTLDAFLAHGDARETLTTEPDTARRQLDELKALGIDLDAIMDQLEKEGVKAFVDAYDELLATLSEKRGAVAQAFAGS